MIGMTPAASDDEIEAPPRCRLASMRARGGERNVLEIGDRRIGGERFVVIAGPCTVETREQTLAIARLVKAGGADGIVVEIHPNPDAAICDGPQSLRCDDFARFVARVEQVAEIAGKQLAVAAR